MKSVSARASFIGLFLFLLSASSAYPQNSLAIIRFTEAEEAYNSGEYSKSLGYLDETDKLLGSSNSKTLYLRILNTHKLIEEAISYFYHYNDTKRISQVGIEDYYNLFKNCQEYLSKYTSVPEKFKAVEEVYRGYKNQHSLTYYYDEYRKGDGNAAFVLGKFLREYSCFEKSAAYFKAGVMRGNSDAMIALGGYMRRGQAGEQDELKARELYLNAYQKGNLKACKFIGDTYYLKEAHEFDSSEPHGLKNVDLKEAYKWYSTGAEKGDPEAMVSLGDFLLFAPLYDTSFPRDTMKAVQLYQQALEKENISAMARLADLYQEGKVVPRKDYKKAHELALKAAKNDSFLGAITMFELLHYGKGVPKDIDGSWKWSHKGAGMLQRSGLYYGDYSYELIRAGDYYKNLYTANLPKAHQLGTHFLTHPGNHLYPGDYILKNCADRGHIPSMQVLYDYYSSRAENSADKKYYKDLAKEMQAKMKKAAKG